jgi:AraC-like DNA-binding protein
VTLRRCGALRVKGIYSVGELASAAGIDRRHLRRLFAQRGVELMKVDNVYYVSLADLELKVRALWEGIKAAEAFVRGLR